MNAELESVLNKLKALLGTGVDATVADATDLEARAKEAKLGTKAVDIDAGTKALAAVEGLEAKLTQALKLIADQADEIAGLKASATTMETAQKAHQHRAEKAIKEVADLLVVLNAKPELTTPPEQAKLAAIESATAAKVKAAQEGTAPRGGMALQKTVFGPDGSKTIVPV